MKGRIFYLDFEELHFPAAYAEKREAFYKKLAFVDDGKASARCADWIEEKLG